MPEVVNGARRGAVYIGRPSKWGNPFVLGRDGSRAEVVALHRKYFLANARLVADAKKELRGQDLRCFCSPQACHGDTLLEIANAP